MLMHVKIGSVRGTENFDIGLTFKISVKLNTMRVCTLIQWQIKYGLPNLTQRLTSTLLAVTMLLRSKG